jgi:hypothetical protein
MAILKVHMIKTKYHTLSLAYPVRGKGGIASAAPAVPLSVFRQRNNSAVRDPPCRKMTRKAITMLWLGHWEFCGERDCPDVETVSRLEDRSSARQWLQQLETGAHKTLAMRALLWQESSGWPLSRMSDEEIIDQIAELLVSGRLHVHVQPARRVSAASSAVSEPVVPFPLSERKPRPQAVAYSAPVSDPPTFPSDLDGAAQASALVAAAASGQPFCPQ